jgi:hypothetical protein
MTTIGVISDTHIRAGGMRAVGRRASFDDVEGVSLILHGGVLTSEHVLTDSGGQSRLFWPVLWQQRGWGLTNKLPQTRRVRLKSVGHRLDARATLSAATDRAPLEFAGNRYAAAQHGRHSSTMVTVSCVFSGTHIARCASGTKWRPASTHVQPRLAHDKRYGPHYSLGILRVDGSQIQGEIISW